MDGGMVAIIFAATAGVMTTFAGAFVLIYTTIKKNEQKLEDIHILVNSNLEKVKSELAAALEELAVLRAAEEKPSVNP